jgi:hypothetical protein
MNKGMDTMTRSELSFTLDMIWDAVQDNAKTESSQFEYGSFEHHDVYRQAYSGLIGRLEGVIMSLHHHLPEEGLKVLQDQLAYALRSVAPDKVEV